MELAICLQALRYEALAAKADVTIEKAVAVTKSNIVDGKEN
jgi:hypothetical protein